MTVWPSELRWAHRGRGVSSDSQGPSAPQPKVPEGQIHQEPEGRGQKARKGCVE